MSYKEYKKLAIKVISLTIIITAIVCYFILKKQ